VVRPSNHTNFEQKLKKRHADLGLRAGHRVRDLLEAVESVALPKAELRYSWLYQMTHAINTMRRSTRGRRDPWLRACKEGRPVCYTEDVGPTTPSTRSAGWIYRHGVDPADKILSTPRDG